MRPLPWLAGSYRAPENLAGVWTGMLALEAAGDVDVIILMDSDRSDPAR